MRKFSAFLGLATFCSALAAHCPLFAQPKVGESKNIIIAPKKAGSPDPLEKPGWIVIRPNGKPPSLVSESPTLPVLPGGTPSTVTTPKQPTPAPVTGQPVRPVSGGLAVPPPTNKPEADVVFDYWFAASVEGQRIGYVQWGAKKAKKNDRELIVGVKYQNFTVSRFGQVVSQWGEESTVETPEGAILVTGMRQGIGKDQALVLSGIVDGKTLKITGDGAAKGAANTPWPEGVVGCVREPALFKEKRLKVNESFDYLSYIGVVNRVVKMTVTLEGEETLALWPKEPARKLLRYTTKMEPVGQFKLPPATTWVDA